MAVLDQQGEGQGQGATGDCVGQEAAGERSRRLGEVTVGARAETILGRLHWKEMLVMAGQPVAHWHPLYKNL